jgi:hypothetical protein
MHHLKCLKCGVCHNQPKSQGRHRAIRTPAGVVTRGRSSTLGTIPFFLRRTFSKRVATARPKGQGKAPRAQGKISGTSARS